jgi:hypothetical protein
MTKKNYQGGITMSKIPSALPECGHGFEPTTFLFLSCRVGARHQVACRKAIDELQKLFAATGTSIELQTWVSRISQEDPATGKYLDVLPPTYTLSLGCAKTYQPLAEKSGQLLTAKQLLAFISETLKGGTE